MLYRCSIFEIYAIRLYAHCVVLHHRGLEPKVIFTATSLIESLWRTTIESGVIEYPGCSGGDASLSSVFVR